MPNQAVSLWSAQANTFGNRPSSAAARDTSVVTRVQPFTAPIPDPTASAAPTCPAHARGVKIVGTAVTNGAVSVTRAWCGPSPMIAADTVMYSTALASVPSTDARPTFFCGSRTRLAVMAATSTPMKENSATPAAIPIALYELPPDALNAPKLPLDTKNQPTTPTNSSGRHFKPTASI